MPQLQYQPYSQIVIIAKWATILVVEFNTKIATFLVGIGKKGLVLKAVSKVSDLAVYLILSISPFNYKDSEI